MIFGLGSPSIAYDGTTVPLTHASIETYDWFDNDQLEHKSVINGDRNYINKGAYCKYTVTDYLFKYASPADQFAKLYTAIGRDLIFRPHKDKDAANDNAGEPIQYDGTAVNFRITEFKPFYIDNVNSKDAITITFEPRKYTTIIDSVTTGGPPS